MTYFTLKNFFRDRPLFLLALLSGLLLSLSWPVRGVPFLAFIAFIPLLRIDDIVLANRQNYNRYTVLLYAWLSFILFNAFTTWWIYYASLPGVLMAVFLNSLFMAIPFALMHAGRRVLSGNQGPSSLIILWISFEFLHLDWDLSWSWLNLGNVFASVPNWIQWYEYTGTLGGTAWVLLMNILLYKLLQTYTVPIQSVEIEATTDTTGKEGKKHVETILKNYQQYQLIKKRSILGTVTFFCLVVPVALSFWIGKNYQMPDDPIEVVIVQPGRDPYMKPSGAEQRRIWVDSLLILANEKVGNHTRFVIAPEAALPSGLWVHDPDRHYGYAALAGHALQFDSLTWVAGVMMYERYENRRQASSTARPLHGSDEYYDVYNAALKIDSQGNMDSYVKSKLVPGIERMPFARYLRLIGTLVEKFGGTSGSMGVQDKRGVFAGIDGTLVAPVICYESIYGEYLNEYILNGAQLIFIITNDGWWRDTPGYRQHNQYARLRAIETRRSIARSAKTGISGFIDPKGNVIQQTSWWEADSIKATIHKNDQITFYVKNGDYLGRLSLFLTILLLLYMISQGIIKRQRKL